MILQAIKYIRDFQTPSEWKIIGHGDDYVHFGNINLLVGKNASGKSRTLAMIGEIAELISGNVRVSDTGFPNQKFDLIFGDNVNKFNYILDIQDYVIISELLLMDGIEILNRAHSRITDFGGGDVFVNSKKDELFILTKRPNGIYYCDGIIGWANSLRNYCFANQIERDRIGDEVLIGGGNCLMNAKASVVPVFEQGLTLFKRRFVDEVKADMQLLGYDISDISIDDYHGNKMLLLCEENRFMVHQNQMSQGMFRALALFILLTYARMSNDTLTLLIDDLGEGLDFERSKGLIQIAIKKINYSNIQIILTSNDRYIMNEIPLKYWLVLDRCHSQSVFYDYINSTAFYEDFRYTGLNNFDFLTTDFYKYGFGEAESENDMDT